MLAGMRGVKPRLWFVFVGFTAITFVSAAPQFTLPITRLFYSSLAHKDFSKAWICNFVWTPACGFAVAYAGWHGWPGFILGLLFLWAMFLPAFVAAGLTVVVSRIFRPECPPVKRW